ncbi:hypothetical protein B0J17DRAFT_631846 [Rhizoctonia solani]|nr:hypothetical protein B0J17DRAFT_631846 [Rhizoctonia solani]
MTQSRKRRLKLESATRAFAGLTTLLKTGKKQRVKLTKDTEQTPADPIDKSTAEETTQELENSQTGSNSNKLIRPSLPNCPPTGREAKTALRKLDAAICTCWPRGGYVYFELDHVTRKRFAAIKACLNHYTRSHSHQFITASLHASWGQGYGATYARSVCQWVRTLIQSGDLPWFKHGLWNKSILEDEDIAQEIKLHLQQIGKYARAEDIVHFLSNPETRARLNIPKAISQYFDGHEQADVVEYRQSIFVPFWRHLERLRVIYNEDGLPDPQHPMALRPGKKPIIFWFHDESVFFGNDCRLVRWVHIDEQSVPFKKGQGNTIMVTDFVYPEFGWLRGRNGKSARVIFRPGSGRDGYFKCNKVVEQLRNAIKIVKDTFPEYTHIFIYDNAPSHTKCPNNAISARRMPKKAFPKFPRSLIDSEGLQLEYKGLLMHILVAVVARKQSNGPLRSFGAIVKRQHTFHTTKLHLDMYMDSHKYRNSFLAWSNVICEAAWTPECAN